MTQPMYRSRAQRRRKVKTPGGRVVTRYSPRKPKAAHCARCGNKLSGVPNEIPSRMHRITRSQRRPERPYGGVLCSSCTREHYRSLL